MDDLDNARDWIIENGFLELKGINIKTEYQRMKDSFAEYERLSKCNYLTTIDLSLRNCSSDVLRGCMAHEIAHIFRDLKKGDLMSALDLFLYNNFSSYQTRDERETDLLVVERGLGRELLEFVKFANKSRVDYNSSEGLTQKELEELLR